MITLTIITVGAVGFVLGLYVSSQIIEHVDSNINHKKFLRNLRDFDKKQDNGQEKSRRDL